MKLKAWIKLAIKEKNRNFPHRSRSLKASRNYGVALPCQAICALLVFAGERKRAQDCPGKFFRSLELNWFLRKPCPSYGAPIARLSNKFNLRRKKGPAGGALSYGFLIYGVNKQRAARGFGKGMEIHGSGWFWPTGRRQNGVGAILNEYRTGGMSSRDTIDETLTTHSKEIA